MTGSLGALLGTGSAKDLYEVVGHPAHVAFQFSDRVSVFDYGALPETVPGRGANLERCARAFEEFFAESEIPTSFDGEVSRQTGLFCCKRVSHPKFPSLSAQELQFVPLEVIFRLGVTPGSSLLKREPHLKPFTRFEKPRVEFSTKLESSDRMVDLTEAAQLAGGPGVLEQVSALAQKVAELLGAHFKKMGLELWDGKVECALDRSTNSVILVDALTPDELRATLPGAQNIPLSKELLRLWLGATPWAASIVAAKAQTPNWKERIAQPPRLGSWRLHRLSALFDSFARSLELRRADALFDWIRKEVSAPKVFVMGSGGREAALKWRLKIEGAELIDEVNSADAVFVCQDADLAAGVVDQLSKERVWAFGPSREASKIEWSKAFGREVAREAEIPIPRVELVLESSTDLKARLDKLGPQAPVVKFDGLAAGKGVVVAESFDEALRALQKWNAQGDVLLEERMHGVEASAFFAVQMGSTLSCDFLGTAKDFKRRFAGDVGPNTGGMGSLAPHPDVTPSDIAMFEEWAKSTAKVLASRGIFYNGILYLGLMKDQSRDWKLVEFNARPGDPETQALVVLWPEQQRVLRSMLGLDIKSAGPVKDSLESKTVCLSLVRGEYPDAPAQRDFKLPDWKVGESSAIHLFRNASVQGRVAYLVGKAATYPEAGDAIFAQLVESPWKKLLEWRADILS